MSTVQLLKPIKRYLKCCGLGRFGAVRLTLPLVALISTVRKIYLIIILYHRVELHR